MSYRVNGVTYRNSVMSNAVEERSNCVDGVTYYENIILNAQGGGGGGSQQSFIRGGSAPRSKPLPFYEPFLIEKVSLLHTSQRKWYPFHIPSWGFKIFCPFQIPKWQSSLPFPILELMKSLPFHIPPA